MILNRTCAAASIPLAVFLFGASASSLHGAPSANLTVTADPPTIDGTLDDEAWSSATAINDFTQVEPEEGRPPTEKTTVYLMRSRESLFVGVRCHDSDPPGVIARDKRRDSLGSGDDRVRFAFGARPVRARHGWLLVRPHRRRREG